MPVPIPSPSSRTQPLPALATLTPAIFGIVMATGIVSLASRQHGLIGLGRGLFALNIAFYLSIWGLVVSRAIRYPFQVLADLVDHARAPGYFTAVAATAVLGLQFIDFGGREDIGFALWWFALGLWLVLGYGIFAALTVKPEKPALDRGMHGGWLLAVVATQSIAVLGIALLNAFSEAWRPLLGFACLALWLWGGMLYTLLMALIFYRCLFLRLSPEDLSPPYWINMGAMAISTLAGARLALAAGSLPVLEQFLPFLKGFSVFYWASGSWWIPLLLVLGVWRHLLRRFPLRYDPLYWSAVFPLGMYAAATHDLSRALNISFLGWLPPIFLSTAWLAWSLALVGLLLAGVRLSGKR